MSYNRVDAISNIVDTYVVQLFFFSWCVFFIQYFFLFKFFTALENLQEKIYNISTLFQNWWSCMLAVSVTIIFLLKPVFLILHSPKKSYESKLETKKWNNKSIDILNAVCFQWSKLKTAKRFFGENRRRCTNIKNCKPFCYYSAIIHPKEKQFCIWDFHVKQFCCLCNGFNSHISFYS